LRHSSPLQAAEYSAVGSINRLIEKWTRIFTPR
jgi:hypothetical protein